MPATIQCQRPRRADRLEKAAIADKVRKDAVEALQGQPFGGMTISRLAESIAPHVLPQGGARLRPLDDIERPPFLAVDGARRS